MTMTEDTHIEALRAQLRAAGQEYADRLADLVPAAQEIADLETALRVAENQAGIRDPRPPARELAHEMVCGRLGCLRPYLAFGTAESADRAQEALVSPPRKSRAGR